MQLSQEQVREFYDSGVLKLPGVVPVELVNRAKRAINAYIGEHGIDPNELTKYRAQSYCPGLGSESMISDLYNSSPLSETAELLIGTGKVKPVKAGQIALRFPGGEVTARPARPHLDGMYSPTNGVKEGTIANFTALVGVLLSDVPDPDSGNFSYWPGSHRKYEAYFRENGPEALLKGLPPVDIGEPVQLTGMAGDAVIVHYQIGHGITGNISPNIRYAIFFRLYHVDHDACHWECMTDIWREWEGLRAVK